MSEDGVLRGDVAIVTGAGRNIGAATATRFASEGARVVVADVDEGRAQSTVDAIEDDGGEALAAVVDVTDEAEVGAMVAKTEDAFGPVDVLVNAAGVREQTGFFDLTVDQFDRVLAVNLKGPFLCTREAAKSMRHSGGGRVVNFSSTSGVRGRPDTVAYATSKSGVRNFTRSAAKALAEYDIRVNTVVPDKSGVRTLTPEQVERGPVVDDTYDEPPETLVGRWGTAEDQAGAALFLVSPESEFVTGAELLVDGGMMA